MKFKQIEGLVFWWPVPVRVPDPEKAGAVTELEFDVQFLQLSSEAIDGFGADENALMRAAVQNWRKVEDDNDKPIAFSPAGLDRLLASQFVKPALFRAYAEGLSAAPRKN